MSRQPTPLTLVVDAWNAPIGWLDGVHIDSDGGAWAATMCGQFGARLRLVPLHGARMLHGNLQVTAAAASVRRAPYVDASPLLDRADTDMLRAHYDAAALAEIWFGGDDDRFEHQ